MNKLRLSIGIPVHNGAEFLGETIESYLGQTFSDFELIISDNASTDNTETIAHRYAARDSRVRYVRNAVNIGANQNFNQVFALGNAEYFKWAASDDLCKPEFLARCIEELEADPSVVLACTNTLFFDANGLRPDLTDPGWNLRSDSAVERLRYAMFANHWVNSLAGVIRRSALERTHLLPKFAGGDYCLMAELAAQGKLVQIAEPLFLRRLHPGSSSQNTTDQKWQKEFFKAGLGATCLPTWYRTAHHFRTILASDLGFREKLRLLGCLLQSMRWRQPRLIAEIKNFFTALYWRFTQRWRVYEVRTAR